MPATPGASRVHAGEMEGAAATSVPITAQRQQTFIVEGRIRRYWRSTWNGLGWVWYSLSAIGTALMVVYQYLYPWGHQLPFGWSEQGPASWVTAFVVAAIYVITRLPHLLGQEPGDHKGLLREVLLAIVNLLMATIFLTRAYAGMPHPPNAVGISILLGALALGIIAWEIIQTVRLSVRTWTDSTGGV